MRLKLQDKQDEFGSKKKKRPIFLDLDERCFSIRNLHHRETNFLLREGYKYSVQKSIMRKESELYLIKPRYNESNSHFFLVYDIVNYLRRYTNNIALFETTRPDILFIINNQTFAVEVETGKTLKHNKKQLLDKVEMLNKNYENWFFVLTNKNLVKKYREFGKVVDKRYLTNYIDKIDKGKIREIKEESPDEEDIPLGMDLETPIYY